MISTIVPALLGQQYRSVFKVGRLISQQHPCSFFSQHNTSNDRCLQLLNSRNSTRCFHSITFKQANDSYSSFQGKGLAVNSIQYEQTRAAGHAKWQNIKNVKEANDKMRSITFSRIATSIKRALKDGSDNPLSNTRLAAALKEAQKANMPSSTIKAVFEKSKKAMENGKEYFLEYKGTDGLYIYVKLFTDNLKRGKAMCNTVFKRASFNFREEKNSAIRHLFDERGIIVSPAKIETKEVTYSEAEEHAIEVGAEEVELEEGVLQFMCGPRDLHSVRKGLEALGYTIDASEVLFLPKMPVTLDDAGMEAIAETISKLEECEDVERAYCNVA